MTDLDALRSALHDSPAGASGRVDIAAVMTAGRRIRTRRRLVRGCGVVGGTAALVVAILTVGGPGAGTDPEQPTIVVTAAKPADPNSIPAGNVVMTGFDNEVLYFVAGYQEARLHREDGATDSPRVEEERAQGGTGYGLTLGNTGVGRIVPLQTTGAAGHWTGFHSITIRDTGAVRLYGYYEGPVRRIELELENEPVAVARTAAWSADSNIVVFWFARQDIPDDHDLGSYRLVAYDQDERVLPF